MIAREKASGHARVVFADGNDSVVIEDAKYRARCAVTRTLTPTATQVDAWQCVGDVIPLVLSGFNSTILAYGHTSSGKTFTLFGNDAVGFETLFAPSGAYKADHAESTGEELAGVAQSAALSMHSDAGLIPRALAAVFAAVGASGSGNGNSDVPSTSGAEDKLRVFVSAMQIYNEDAFDLLDAEPSALEIRSSPEDGVFAAGLQEFEVESAAEALGVVAAAARARVVRETEHNVQSSRSHTIVQVTVERERIGDMAAGGEAGAGTMRSKLNLVDLAGSERWDIHAASGWEAARVSELTSINSSLFVLTRVISALSEASGSTGALPISDDGEHVRGVHIPYRESTLTRLLQDSLGGNAVTCIFCTLTPSRDAVSESLNTLIFADAARRVMTRARINDSALPDAVVIRKLREEVLKLRRETLELRETGSTAAAGAGGGFAAVALPKAVEGMVVALRQVSAIVSSFEEEVIELGARAELEHVAGRSLGRLPATITEEAEDGWDSLDRPAGTVAGALAAGAAAPGRMSGVESGVSGDGAAAGALTERALVFCAALSAVTAEALQPHSLRKAYASAAATESGRTTAPTGDAGTAVASGSGGTRATGGEGGGKAGRPSTTGASSGSPVGGGKRDVPGRGTLSARGSSGGGPQSAWETQEACEKVGVLTDEILEAPASPPLTKLPQLRGASAGAEGEAEAAPDTRGLLALPRVRLRDKRGRVVDVAEREASLRAAHERRSVEDMRELEKRVEMNRKLQEWTQQKLQREEAAAAAMKQAEEAMRVEARKAERRRLRRARQLKRQLQKREAIAKKVQASKGGDNGDDGRASRQHESSARSSPTRRFGKLEEDNEDSGRDGDGAADADEAWELSSMPRRLQASKASRSPAKASHTGQSPRRPPPSPVGSTRAASGAMSVRSPRLAGLLSARRAVDGTSAADDDALKRDVKAFLAGGEPTVTAKGGPKPRKPAGDEAASGGSASARRKRSPRHKGGAIKKHGSSAPKSFKEMQGARGTDGVGVTLGAGGDTGWRASTEEAEPEEEEASRGWGTGGAGRSHTVSRALMEETDAAIAAADAAAEEAAWALAALNAPRLGVGVSGVSEQVSSGTDDYRYGGSRLGDRPASRHLTPGSAAEISAGRTARSAQAGRLLGENNSRPEVPPLALGEPFSRAEAGSAPPSRREDLAAFQTAADSETVSFSMHRPPQLLHPRAASVMDNDLVPSSCNSAVASGRPLSPLATMPAASSATVPADAPAASSSSSFSEPKVQFLAAGASLEDVLAAQGLRMQGGEGDGGTISYAKDGQLRPTAMPFGETRSHVDMRPRPDAGGENSVSGAGVDSQVIVRRIHQPVVVVNGANVQSGSKVEDALPKGTDAPEELAQRRKWAYDAASAPFSSRFGVQ